VENANNISERHLWTSIKITIGPKGLFSPSIQHMLGTIDRYKT